MGERERVKFKSTWVNEYKKSRKQLKIKNIETIFFIIKEVFI